MGSDFGGANEIAGKAMNLAFISIFTAFDAYHSNSAYAVAIATLISDFKVNRQKATRLIPSIGR